jgi:hypothetical protein
VQRIVNVREARGWRVDRIEQESLLPDALDSVCRATPEARTAVLAWIDGRIVALGGNVEEAWRKAGRRLSRVRPLLELHRIRLILGAAVEVAPRDCPFWLTPGEPFGGRQIADDRWLLTVEGGGKGILLRSAGENDFAGGGAGRLLIGRAFGRHFGLHAGVEGGGSAGFPRDATGARTSLVLALDVVVPLVLRVRFVNSYLEVEGGWLTHVTEDDTDARSGIHAGVALGVRSARERWFTPGLALALTWERVFEDGAAPAIDFVKLGLRVSIDVDL